MPRPGRLLVLHVVIGAMLITLLGRLWYLQVADGPAYVRAAAETRVRTVAIAPVRGRILDATGLPLVANRTVPVVAVDYMALTHQADGGRAVLARLAEVLREPYERVAERVRLCGGEVRRPCWPGSPYQPIPVAGEVDVPTALQITERQEEFPGVSTELQPIRTYPLGPAAVHTLGYVQAGTGQDGLEAGYDRELAGTPGRRDVVVGSTGEVAHVLREIPPVPGADLVTSLDARIQQVSERALADAIAGARRRGLPADSGAAVVLEAATGRVTALAANPSYNPEVWTGGVSQREFEALPLASRAVLGQWPPGSTWKVASVAAAAKAGYDLSASYDCPGNYRVGDRSFRNFGGLALGRMDLREALVQSCDTIFYRIADELWADRRDGVLGEVAKGFGFGARTGVDLPSEAKGAVPGTGDLPGHAANFAIGQGDVLVTPLQLARAYAAIANGGTLFSPRVAKAVVRPGGEVIRTITPPSGRVPVPPDVLAFIRDALTDVPRTGTAATAFTGFAHSIAGKTGTAEVSGRADTSWFASFDQRHVVVVVVSQGGTGAETAAPAARAIWEGISL
ncbi:penicillin-binding protein 2 [Acrocarpospora macrocephala]|uniref:Penicillin-binding protein 2 n=1 Tax=Acrocarpospora macrocephala TaxID=150177 RepID=A0A5M3X8H1_9ACTN|nr:penicillin-binding transpeptidase domain-containing protein [Acrocarpospora macrocephala]GES14478.1 penicillin-binding protein 2 [Acrocarpospora macrocephala]